MDFFPITLATTAGSLYNFSFWLSTRGGPPNDFSASFNGVTVYSVTDAPAFGYTQFTLTGLLATSKSTMLQFSFRQDPRFWRLMTSLRLTFRRGTESTELAASHWG